MIKEGSFTARLSISGYPTPCNLSFLRANQHGYSGQNKLCANSKNILGEGELFHFENQGNGEYTVTIRGRLAYPGYYLGISTDNYVVAFKEKAEKNNFSFKKDGTILNISNIEGNTISGWEMVCRDGGIELHDLFNPPHDEGHWSAYIKTKNGNAGLIGPNIVLKIVERNVE